MTKLMFLMKKNDGFSHLKRWVQFTMLQLLQHSVQLGVSAKFSLLSSHWFLFGVYKNFTIIHLAQTVLHYRLFLQIVDCIAFSRRHILFVNERSYSTTVVAEVAKSVGEAYVIGRWVGGSLTNFRKIWAMHKRLLAPRTEAELNTFRCRLKKTLSGMSVLHSLPAAVFLNSVKWSRWAMCESYAMHIPVGGITDTDALPHSVLYPIPGNDDAFSSIFFFNKLVAKAALISKVSLIIKKYREFYIKSETRDLKDQIRKLKRVLFDLKRRVKRKSR